MGIMDTVFDEWCERGIFAIINGDIYEPFPREPDASDEEPYLQFFGRRFRLERQGSTAEIFSKPTIDAYWRESNPYSETKQTSAVGEDTLRMLDTIIQEIIPIIHYPGADPTTSVQEHQQPKNSPVHQKAASYFRENYLFCGGKGFRLKWSPFSLFSRPKELIVCEKTYRIAGEVDIEGLKERYRSAIAADINAHLEERIGDTARQSSYKDLADAVRGAYHDPRSGAGIARVEDAYYVYRKIPAFDLYEPLDNSYYHFPSVRVATRVYLHEGEFRWEHPRVLDAYSHPALEGDGKSMQRICLGPDNNRLASLLSKLTRGEGEFTQQVRDALSSAVKVLESGYRTDIAHSIYRPWNKIAEHPERYSHMRTQCPDRVTNM